MVYLFTRYDLRFIFWRNVFDGLSFHTLCCTVYLFYTVCFMVYLFTRYDLRLIFHTMRFTVYLFTRYVLRFIFSYVIFYSLERNLTLIRRENDAFRSSMSGGSLPSHSMSPTPPSLSSYTEMCIKSLQEHTAAAQVHTLRIHVYI